MTRVVDYETIKKALSFDRLIPRLKQAFSDDARGMTRVAPITNIDLPEVNGEMHIKPGYMVEGATVCVKIATCYYDNPSRGLPTRDGTIVVANRSDGRIRAILCDAGLITDMRTAGSSAVAVDTLAPARPLRLGLIGAGTQAYWHALAVSRVREISEIFLWGRNAERAQKAAKRISEQAKISTRPASLSEAAGCDVVVTATPARKAVLNDERLKPGAVVVSMGSDAAGKRELGPAILGQASLIVPDNLGQCRRLGELQWVDQNDGRLRIVELGHIILDRSLGRRSEAEVVIFDSTGVAFQDVVGAEVVLEALQPPQ